MGRKKKTLPAETCKENNCTHGQTIQLGDGRFFVIYRCPKCGSESWM